MPNNSIVLFQMVGHNPTATDPTLEQWREMSQILKGKNVLVFFDMAYQVSWTKRSFRSYRSLLLKAFVNLKKCFLDKDWTGSDNKFNFYNFCQGFGSGCFETDAFPLRYFIEEGHKVVFAQSYSKNMVRSLLEFLKNRLNPFTVTRAFTACA